MQQSAYFLDKIVLPITIVNITHRVSYTCDFIGLCKDHGIL